MTNKFGNFVIIKKCNKTAARASILSLRTVARLPTFMPVATKAAMKGVPSYLLDEEIILANTYHCRDLMNLSSLMSYKKNMLTDSGGFQIVSLKEAVVNEEGVTFYDTNEKGERKTITLKPEDSINIQSRLGADIIMQLDHVVNPLSDERCIEEAMLRSIRWLDRCYAVHNNPLQLLFPIIQGGLHEHLRKASVKALLKFTPRGIAIGGLSGGENKADFISIIKYTISLLPVNIPRYVMGVGYPEDIIACVAAGSDMSDCVYPTRTARFGRAMKDEGDLNLSRSIFSNDLNPIDASCECSTCIQYSRAFIHSLKGISNFCILISIHNIFYMKKFMSRMRSSIIDGDFEGFAKKWILLRFKGKTPQWLTDFFGTFNISF